MSKLGFSKSDLCADMQVETRNGTRYVIITGTRTGDWVIKVRGMSHIHFSNLTDDLRFTRDDSLDIMKVYENRLGIGTSFLIKSLNESQYIWHRGTQ